MNHYLRYCCLSRVLEKTVALRFLRVYSILKVTSPIVCRSFTVKKMSSVTPAKPPNVLVYTGENQESVFKNIEVNFLRCLHPEKYVVYELKKAQVLCSPWRENVSLLVVCCDVIEDTIAETFTDYLHSDGNMIVFCSNMSAPKLGLVCSSTAKQGVIKIKYKSVESTLFYRGKYSYTLDNSETLATNTDEEPVVMKANYNKGALIVSEVYFALESFLFPSERDSLRDDEENRLLILKGILGELGLEVYSAEVPVPTPGYVIFKDKTLSELMDVKEVSLGKVDKFPYDSGEITELKVPLLFDNETSSTFFDKNAYFSKLNTNTFGRVIVFFPVVTSTMILAEQFSDQEGIVIIARCQNSGLGRGGNKWISPEGSAMFTLHFSLSLTSRIGQRMSIMQHMTSLSVVHGIRKIPVYKELDLRLKWPNDIYFENDKKIGGVLVKTTIQGNVVHAYIGVGVNVSNQRPTTCINSVIKAHNDATGDALPLLKTEEVIATALTELEYLIDDFTKNGPENFLKLYYTYWLHKEQQVVLSSLKKEATIHGVDDYGFLIVQTVEGKRLTLQPDGNRFDMLKNLIVAKG